MSLLWASNWSVGNVAPQAAASLNFLCSPSMGDGPIWLVEEAPASHNWLWQAVVWPMQLKQLDQSSGCRYYPLLTGWPGSIHERPFHPQVQQGAPLPRPVPAPLGAPTCNSSWPETVLAGCTDSGPYLCGPIACFKHSC